MLARNTLLNLLGLGAPLLVAIFAIPLLIAQLSINRFGVLALIWMVIGYLSLFDLGLGRALTQQLSELLGRENPLDADNLVWTALALMLALGIVGAILIVALTHWTVGSVLRIPKELQSETARAFYVMAISLPFVITTTGLRGILESFGRFGIINAIRLPMGIVTFLGPLAVTYIENDLAYIAGILVITRILAWALHLYCCFQAMPLMRDGVRISREHAKLLLVSGGWMTVSNVISPLMGYLDRIFLGMTGSLAAVTYYVTPNELVTKLGIVPGAITATLFPQFAAKHLLLGQEMMDLLFRCSRYLFLVLFPVLFFVVLFAHELLTLWLGESFANKSFRALQYLMVGMTVNCFAQLPFTLIQASGRSSVTAKIHLAELVPYAIMLWGAAYFEGINGVALVWALRAVIDTLLMYRYTVPIPRPWALQDKHVALLLLLVLSGLTAAFMITDAIGKVFLLFGGGGSILFYFWRNVLEPSEKRIILRPFVK